MTEAIHIDGVTKCYGSQRAVDDVSFSIPKQTVFGLLGPNGAGKTTLFSLVAGFLKPDTGAIKVLDIDVRAISDLRGRMSILPQDAQFQANVPIVEQVIFLSQLAGNTRAEAVREADKALEVVGLADAARKNPRALSHGMAKRLGIAQAFLGDPEVILLDEPTAGLDPASAAAIRALIETLRKKATLVISSHDLGEIQRMCDQVAILDQGKLVDCRAVSEITKADQRVRMTFASPLSAEQQAAVTAVAGVTEIAEAGANGYLITMEPTEARGSAEITAQIVQTLAATGAVPRSVQEGEALEDHFLSVTKRQGWHQSE